MLVFIDESGDAGFRLEKGSSRTFVIALVIFDEDLDAEETALKIKRYRKELKKTENFEFKFSKCSRDIKLAYFKKIQNSNFKIRAIVIEKEKIQSPNLRSSKEKFYSYVIKTVLKYSHKTIKNAKIRLDGFGEKLFKQSLSTYLRKQLNYGEKAIMKDLKFRNSKNDVLIQLADMVAGAINRSYDKTKTDHLDYRKLLKTRIEDIWEFK